MIDVSHHGDVMLVRPAPARLDAAAAPAFKAALGQQVAAGHNRLVLDMGGVNFIDSSALGALIAVLKMVGPQGAVALANLNPSVMKVVKLTRLDRIFSIHDDAEAAIRSLAG